jgi:hypothetical protein
MFGFPMPNFRFWRNFVAIVDPQISSSTGKYFEISIQFRAKTESRGTERNPIADSRLPASASSNGRHPI